MEIATLKVCLNDENGQIDLIGELNAQTVTEAYQQGNVFLNGVERLTINLGKVTRSDSAGLALLLAWMRRAKEQNVTITFKNFPQKMCDLGRVSGLDAILPITK